MPYLLNLVYLALLLALSPWIAWAALRHGKYRQGYREKLFGLVPRREDILPDTDSSTKDSSVSSDKTKIVWLHAVSVGEVNLLATLLKQIANTRPTWQCVISTTTRTGYELAKRRYAELPVFYCPLDFSWSTTRAMRRLRPDLLILAELELWPNLIRAASKQGAKIAIVNGRLSDRSFRGYRRIRTLVARVLRRVSFIGAQDEATADRFDALGANRSTVQVTGSLKYDGAPTDRANPKTQTLARLAGFQSQDIVFLAGSTQAPEEQLALSAYEQLAPRFPNLRLVLVPRHPERFDSVAEMLREQGATFVRRSEMSDEKNSSEERDSESNNRPILLVDTIGELGAWWGTAQIAFVGGSLSNRGGQNMLEPAAYGAAVSFGPNTKNFRDIVAALLSADAAMVVADGEEIVAFVLRCLEDPDWANRLGENAQRLVQSQLGATERTVSQLGLLFAESDSDREIDSTKRRQADRPAA